jgi:hypothetical protein
MNKYRITLVIELSSNDTLPTVALSGSMEDVFTMMDNIPEPDTSGDIGTATFNIEALPC